MRYAIHHVPADGNCMFSAIAHQLAPRIFESSKTAHHEVRLEVVEYLRSHPDIVSTSTYIEGDDRPAMKEFRIQII